MISSVKAHKILNKGYASYLAQVINRFYLCSMMISNMEGTSMVYEFSNVFLDNLSKLAPE